jgi:methylmalonyl-CoA mutase
MTPTPSSPLPDSPVTDESPAPALDLAADFSAPSVEDWRKQVEADLKGADFDKKMVWRTLEGLAVQPLYTRHDVAELATLPAYPAVAPYVRGNKAQANAATPWLVRQDCVLRAPEEVNAAWRDGLARGETALCMRLDNAARRGFDGDSPAAREFAGRSGCTLSTIGGLRVALADVDIAKVPVFFRTGAAAFPVLAMFLALADERGVARASLSGGVEFDPIRSLAKNGRLRAPLSCLWAQMEDMVRLCAEQAPGIRPVSVNSHPAHNAGASAVEELAYLISAGVEYLRALDERGVAVPEASAAMGFSVSVSTNVYLEVAKLRAARALWAKVVKAFGCDDPAAQRMFLHARTSARTKTVHDPYNNMLRTQVEAFAAVLGGVDSLFVAPFDEPYGPPTEFAARIARNQHHLLREEAGLGRVVDPTAGSYAIEALTDQIAREAWRMVQEIDAAGGLVSAMVKGLPQGRVAATAAKRDALVRTRREPIVGVSNYPNPAEALLARQTEESRREFLEVRRQKLARVKGTRDNNRVRVALAELAEAADGRTENLLARAVECARHSATIGEILDAVTEGDGATDVTATPFAARRLSEPFEALRRRAERHREITGKLPNAVLLTTGPLGMRRARADFSTAFYGAAGFTTCEIGPFESVNDAVAAVLESPDRLVVVCSDDATYPVFVPEFVQALKLVKPSAVVHVAGWPTESVDALKAAGVDGFIHVRADLIETLTELMDRLGTGN